MEHDNFFLGCMERNIACYGEKIAVCDDKKQLTFRELHEKAGRISAHIRRLVAGEHHCIGIVAEDTAETVVMMLAVIYSGNDYLPLDRELSADVFETISSRTDMKLLLLSRIDGKWEGKIPVFRYESAREGEFYYRAAEPEDALYAILTSGTTGIPKAIRKNHRAMYTYVEVFSRECGLTSEEIIGNQIPFYSDAAAKDIFLMLYLGATLVILPRTGFSMPYTLIEFMNDKKVSFISWVPSAYAMVAQLDALDGIVPVYLKTACFVGEQIPAKVLAYWRGHLKTVTFYNTYGMSELAGVCARYAITDDVEEGQIPIGRPLGHCRLLLVDENFLPAERGQLLVGSVSLASHILTEQGWKPLEKITVTEESGASGSFYPTGDLAYLDDRGNYVVTGRNDYQIKYMGYRIELQGIEAAIMKSDNVAAAVCLFVRQRIVAAVELCEDSEAARKELKSFCRKNLSVYTCPREFRFFSQMPYNRNGKADRKYLMENWNQKEKNG